jgi:hypothetical protein
MVKQPRAWVQRGQFMREMSAAALASSGALMVTTKNVLKYLFY